jgi:hypothetical protein
MRPIVLAALVAALLGACGLALGLSTTDAVEQAVSRHVAGIDYAMSW